MSRDEDVRGCTGILVTVGLMAIAALALALLLFGCALRPLEEDHRHYYLQSDPWREPTSFGTRSSTGRACGQLPSSCSAPGPCDPEAHSVLCWDYDPLELPRVTRFAWDIRWAGSTTPELSRNEWIQRWIDSDGLPREIVVGMDIGLAVQRWIDYADNELVEVCVAACDDTVGLCSGAPATNPNPCIALNWPRICNLDLDTPIACRQRWAREDGGRYRPPGDRTPPDPE